MGPKPLILALANPNPEITPDEALAVRPEAMICTGRSDYPNQVNNVLCFPYIFRGALDVHATAINEEMKLAAVEAIAQLAREAPSDVVANAYGGSAPLFGPTSLIPAPFDPRLILRIAPAVAKAAMQTGVAKKPIADFDAYTEQLNRFVFRSGFIMKPVFAQAKANPKRVIYADGEDERVLRAAQVVLEERMAVPILIGRPSVVESRIKRFGLSIQPGRDFELVNPADDIRYRDYVAALIEAAGRKGITPDAARTIVRTSNTAIAALAVRRGDADAMLCGLEGRFRTRLKMIRDVIGLAPDARNFSALSLLVTNHGHYFIADTHVRQNPSALEIAEMTVKCAEHVRRFGMTPKVALISDSDFGSDDSPAAMKMREALPLVHSLDPGLEVDGEMQADSALSQAIRDRVLVSSTLKGEANVLILPDLTSANIAFQMVKVLADALPVGPILIGAAKPAHILTPSVTARGIVNMTAIAVSEAQATDDNWDPA
jgi:malate dehydrogenase (oxaloacetate-decarboxylating)(NADP+)